MKSIQSSALRPSGLVELLATSDYVLPLLPLTAETQRLFDRRRIGQMKPGALLINVARGSIVDEYAVADALDIGHLGGYAADVFAMEDWARDDRPPGIPSRLLRYADRTLLTPHIGSAVTDVRIETELHAASQIEQVLQGGRPEGAVHDLMTATERTG